MGCQGVAVADDVVDLGLAEHFVGRHAQLLAAVGKHGVAHGLARAHDGLRAQIELLAHGAPRRAGAGLHHGLERRREQKGVVTPQRCISSSADSGA